MILLQEIDYYGDAVNYPLKTESVAISKLYTPSQPLLVSFYDIRTSLMIKHDIYEMIFAFSPFMWFCVGLSLLLFFIIMRFGQKVYGINEHQAGWIVSTFFIGQDYLDENNNFLKVMSIVMSFFSFFLIQWLTNTASTDLVTTREPETIQTYQDVMDNNLQPMWLEGYTSYNHFREASGESIEGRLFKYGSERGEVQLPRMESKVIQYFEPILSGSTVFIDKRDIAVLIPLTLCQYTTDPESHFYNEFLKGLITRDEGSKEYLTGAPYNPRMHPEFIQQILKDEYN